MSYKRGDVVLMLYPDSNLRTTKRRPALVIQADDLKTGLPQVIIAMITSNMARAGHPCRVSLMLSDPAARPTGLLTDSVVMSNRLTAPGPSSPNGCPAFST